MTENPAGHRKVREMVATLKALREIMSASDTPHPLLADIERALGLNTAAAMRPVLEAWFALPLAERERILG